MRLIKSMRLTGSMRLIKSAKNTVGGACVKNVSRVERPIAMAKERPESVFLDVFFSSLLLAFFLGSCNRSLVVQVAYWACAPNKER